MKRILFIAAILALALSACGAQATPTIDPVQVQASAIAAANTMVAQTQAAIPTATPIPPTPIPSPTALPSPTPIPLPTLSAVQASPTVKATSGGTGGDPCNAPLASNAAGPTTTLKIQNSTKANITISLYLNKTAFGECGYRAFQVEKSGAVVVEMPQGCYSAYAWINDPKKPATVSGGGYCVNNPDKWTFTVSADLIKLSPP